MEVTQKIVRLSTSDIDRITSNLIPEADKGYRIAALAHIQVGNEIHTTVVLEKDVKKTKSNSGH